MCPGTGGAGQDAEGSSTSCLGQVSLQGYRALLGTIRVGQSPMGLIQDSGDAAGSGEEAACGTRAGSGDAHPRTPWPLPASHLLSLMMRLETKSLASLETLSKVSSSKYQLAARTLLSVSVSSSPKKGERPLSLGVQRGEESGALRLQHLPDPLEQSQSGQGCSRDVLPPSCLQPG